jgi:diketogulonate reductase-like aldo/keto reductase
VTQVVEPTVSANGAVIPRLGLGTWSLDGRACVAATAAALKAGYRHIDTAAMYGNEADVGAGLARSGVTRAEVFITTKVWSDDIGRGRLQASAKRSLKALGIDVIDLLLIHWPNPQIPLSESLGALADCRQQGLARHIGVSNFPSRMLDEAVRLCPAPLVANECEYHPYLNQNAVLAACRRHGMAFLSYSPLGKADPQLLGEPVIVAAAKRVGRTPAQVVLRWHIQQPGVGAVPKSSSPARIAQNLAVWDFMLTDDEMVAISGLSRVGLRYVDPGMGPDWD